MIACVEKTAQNADFLSIIDFLTGCSINYSLLVDPDLIGPWLQQFWATATLKVINDVPHIRAKVAGKTILISEATIRADLLFDDENGVDCFPKQVIWDTLRDIGYEGNLAQLHTFSTPYLAHSQSTKFSCRITPLTPSMLEVVTALAAEEEQSTSPHSRAASYAREAQGTPTQRAAHSLKCCSFSKVLLIPPTYTSVQVKLGRNKDEGTLSEEHNVQEEDTTHPFFDDIADQDAAVTPDLERKSDETEEVNIEEKEASNVKSGETEELDLETTQSTARQGTITPRTLNFEDEAGPSSPLRPIQGMDSEEQHNAAEVLVSISRPRGLSIPGPIQTQPQQPTQGTDPKDKGKGILVEEPKKKLTFQQIRALETTNDEEVARKIQAEWDAEEERKRFEELKKTKPKTTLRKPTSLAQERNQMMSFLKGQGYKNLQKLKYPQMKELYDKVQALLYSQRLYSNGFVRKKGRKLKERMLKDSKEKESYNI
ncbi:hypothetical protein Tco_0271959 [Tanacetum coccineum]